MQLRIGVDLGGSKIELAALDAAGTERHRRRVPTPAGDYAATVEAIAALVEAAERELGATGTVGIATPGARSLATGLVKNANSTCLNGKPLKQDLERRLGRPVRMANDANCFALSEATDGAGRGAEVVFGVILGTGVGGGIVAQGRIFTGANAIAGEWGHNALPLPAPADHPLPLCYCGRRGCVETYLSGPGLAADHARVAGDRLSAEEIAARAAAGEPACAASIARYEERLARALGTVINVVDPDVIVLGGGLSSIGRLYERVPALWGAYVFSDAVRTRLVPPAHGDASGVRGAAWLWDDQDEGFAPPPVTLRAVEEGNIDLVAEIRVAPTQIYHVASVGKTLWQAGRRDDMWVRAIYAGEKPVGLVALVDKGRDEIYLARVIVDAVWQGRGLGTRAVELAIEHARARAGCRSMRLSYAPSNPRIARFYERFGFRHNGVTDADGEIEMTLIIGPSPGSPP